MQVRNILIHVVVGYAALQAAVIAMPASAVMAVPASAVPAGAARAFEARADESTAYPGRYVAYPEGEVVFLAPADAGNE